MKVGAIYDRYKVKIGGDKIFDPIRNCYVHLTPEEIVRQKTIKFLIQRLKVPKEKLIVERSLSSLGVLGSRKRIDIGVLDDDGLIMAVIECKQVFGNGEFAYAQAQDYLKSLNTRYFFVTDGELFDGFFWNTLQFIKLESIPTYDQWYNYPKG